MEQKNKFILVIDPVLTGSKFVTEAKNRGYGVIGIMTWKNIPTYAKNTFPKDDISEFYEINNDDDLAEILSSKLCNKNISAVFPGTECSVSYAEKARSLLGLTTNNPETSSLRRNKFKMHRALKKHGLAIPTQFEATSVDEIIDWLESNKNGHIEWPVVLKPLSSAGTNGLSFSTNREQLIHNGKKLFQATDLYGKQNETILAQSFVNGTEYVVNTISHHGQHKITDFWRYTKRKVNEAGMIYDRQDLLPIEMVSSLGLQEYTFKSLDALEIKHGPAHCEVMLTANGPVLIEIASRVQGGINTKLLDECLGNNQLSIAFDVALDTNSFSQISIDGKSLKKHACWINLICNEDKTARDLKLFESKIKDLESFCSIYLSITEGQLVKKTVDLMSCPGVVFLLHEKQEQIDRDYKKLRELEKHHY